MAFLQKLIFRSSKDPIQRDKNYSSLEIEIGTKADLRFCAKMILWTRDNAQWSVAPTSEKKTNTGSTQLSWKCPTY